MQEIKEIPEWLKNMPKTDLHCHLGGSLRLPTILEFADNYGVNIGVKTEDELAKKVVYKNHNNKSLQEYLDGIKLCESVLRKPEAFTRAAYEVCEDAARENVKHFELRFGPTNYANDSMRLYEIVEATLDGIHNASKDFNMDVGLIICGIRTDLEATKRAAEIAVNYQSKGVIGFDLAGKENGYRPKLFVEILNPVFYNFLPVTIHAGENDTGESIKDALINLHAQRIGHAVTLLQDPKVVEYLDTTRFGLELCLTSNVDTGAVSSFDTHPARINHHRGLRQSINTDNRTISQTTVTQEYMHLINHLGFTKKEIFQLGRHGIKSAFASSSRTRALLNEFDAYVAENNESIL